jgi:DNA-binding transcriptional ArsR family regulator
MQRRNVKPKPITARFVAKKADSKILMMFPSLNRPKSTCTPDDKEAVLQRLTCLYLLGGCGCVSIPELARALKVSRPTADKEIKRLLSAGLVESAKTGKTTKYVTSTKGFVALITLGEYQEWEKIRAALSTNEKRGDPLAYAILTVGYAANGKPDGVYSALVRYASVGHSMEGIEGNVAAESLLNFYRMEMRAQGAAPPNYLGVFKEFTTTGFQDVFRMLLVAIKPTAEDYNWLVEFFNQVAEFYYDPARAAYVNLLRESKGLRDRLEEFKKTQDLLIKKEGSDLEVTFSVPSAGLQKIDTMPPHLRAMGMRLMLEPIKFINRELCSFFWENKKEEKQPTTLRRRR